MSLFNFFRLEFFHWATEPVTTKPVTPPAAGSQELRQAPKECQHAHVVRSQMRLCLCMLYLTCGIYLLSGRSYPPKFGGDDFTPEFGGMLAKTLQNKGFLKVHPQIWGVNFTPKNLGGWSVALHRLLHETLELAR